MFLDIDQKVEHLVDSNLNMNERDVEPIPLNVPWERNILLLVQRFLVGNAPIEQLHEIDSSLGISGRHF